MDGERYRDRARRRAMTEALACRDVLAVAPPPPSRATRWRTALARGLARLGAAGRTADPPRARLRGGAR